MPTKREIFKYIGVYLIFDALLSLAWGLSSDCLACGNNTQIGNIIRIVRLLAGIYLVRD